MLTPGKACLGFPKKPFVLVELILAVDVDVVMVVVEVAAVIARFEEEEEDHR